MTKSTLTVHIVSLMLLSLSVASLGVSAHAGVGVTRTPGGSSWMPPFPAAAPVQVNMLHLFVGSAGAAVLNARIPSLHALGKFNPQSETDRRAVGALAAYLPQDFYTRMNSALMSPEPLASEHSRLSAELASAHEKAALAVKVIVESRVREIAVSVMHGQMGVEDLADSSRALKPFALFGDSIQKVTAKVDAMARAARSAQIIGGAQKIAAALLTGQALVDDGTSAAAVSDHNMVSPLPAKSNAGAAAQPHDPAQPPQAIDSAALMKQAQFLGGSKARTKDSLAATFAGSGQHAVTIAKIDENRMLKMDPKAVERRLAEAIAADPLLGYRLSAERQAALVADLMNGPNAKTVETKTFTVGLIAIPAVRKMIAVYAAEHRLKYDLQQFGRLPATFVLTIENADAETHLYMIGKQMNSYLTSGW